MGADAKPVAIIMGSQSDWATMRHAADTLSALEIGLEVDLLRRLDQKPTVDVNGALRTPGGARGVADHQRVLGRKRGSVEVPARQVSPPDPSAPIGARRCSASI